MKQWWTARELAEAKLPGVATSERRSRDCIERAKDIAINLVRPRVGRGGGLEVHIDALPPSARAELQRRAIAHTEQRALATVAPSEAPLAKRQKVVAPSHSLTHRQRSAMEARAALLQEVERRIITGRTLLAACEDVAFDANSGTLPADLQAFVSAANDRALEARLSGRTLRRWRSLKDVGGIAALAPAITRQKEDAPTWLDGFLLHYARPQKPDLAEAYRNWIKTVPVTGAPTYSAVRRAVGKLSHLEQARGREGKLTMRARMAYVTRDTSDLMPSTIYVADGTTFDAEIEHPIHGRPFKPEITIILDVATRKAVGWSAGLAESQWTVADALRRAAEIAIPAIFYTDRGSGYRNEAMDCNLTGLLARLGTTAMRALPYNSQAKGNVESFQKRWIKVARTFPTYTGVGMDKEAKQLAFKTTRREIAFVGSSATLPAWAEFVARVSDYVAEYNDTPHRGLPSTRDTATGARRHLTPNELWALKVSQGAELLVPDQDELVDLFRPYEVRRVRRCLIDLGTNSYFATALDAFHGQDVMVGYDIKDPQIVWVRRIDTVDGERRPGALICTAEFEGNKARYVPVSAEQRAIEKRAEGRRRRLNVKMDRVDAELRPNSLMDLRPVAPIIIAPDASDILTTAAPKPEIERPVSANGRPMFRDDVEFARWIEANPSDATAMDRELITELLMSDASKNLLRLRGIDINRLRSVVIEKAA